MYKCSKTKKGNWYHCGTWYENSHYLSEEVNNSKKKLARNNVGIDRKDNLYTGLSDEYTPSRKEKKGGIRDRHH